MKRKTLGGTLLREPVKPHFCAHCGNKLVEGDKITHTFDMTQVWHTPCFKLASMNGKVPDARG